MPDYIVANDWPHIFDDRHGEEWVRFVLDADSKRILAMDSRVSENRAWEPATDEQIADVAEEIESSGNLEYALMEAEVDETDDVPEWAADRVTAPPAPGF